MLKPNKRYSCHTDDNYLKQRAAKDTPWVFIRDNYKISTHFIERCMERRILPKDVSNALINGKKYYIIREHDTEIRYVSEYHGIAERNGILVTALYFGKNNYKRLSFTQDNDNFVLEE